MTAPTSPCPTCGHTATTTNTEEHTFVSARTALILVMAFVCGVVVGLLTFMANGNVPAAILAGICALGATMISLHMLVGR